MSNEFLVFCPVDSSGNLMSQADYDAASGRDSGNPIGVASRALNNKALRQANAVTSQLAQLVTDITGTDTEDDANSDKLLAQMIAALQFFAPVVTKYTSTTPGTHYPTRIFCIDPGSATVAATYTNNGHTFTVSATVASSRYVKMTGDGAPTASGTLTKTSGTGDSTITFYAVRIPISIEVEMVGAGGGGAGATANNGGDGTATSFGSVQAAAGGGGVTNGGTGGVAAAAGTSSLGGGGGIIAIGTPGENGFSLTTPSFALNVNGGHGGNSAFGGRGAAGNNSDAIAAKANSGSGGGGGAKGSGNTGGGGGSS